MELINKELGSISRHTLARLLLLGGTISSEGHNRFQF